MFFSFHFVTFERADCCCSEEKSEESCIGKGRERVTASGEGVSLRNWECVMVEALVVAEVSQWLLKSAWNGHAQPVNIKIHVQLYQQILHA